MGPPKFIGGNRIARNAPARALVVLQWGRRNSSAEMRHGELYAVRLIHSFNGAAEIHRRK